MYLTFWPCDIAFNSCKSCSLATWTTPIFNAVSVAMCMGLGSLHDTLGVSTVYSPTFTLDWLVCRAERSEKSWLWDISLILTSLDPYEKRLRISKFICWRMVMSKMAVLTLKDIVLANSLSCNEVENVLFDRCALDGAYLKN